MFKAIRQSLFWIAVIFAGLVWLRMEHNDRMAEQGQYVKSLERIVSGCLDRKGGTVTIGDEIYLCKSYPTGAKI